MGASGWTTVQAGQWAQLFSGPQVAPPSMDVLARETPPTTPGTFGRVAVRVDRYWSGPPHFWQYNIAMLPGPMVRLMIAPAAWATVWVRPDRTVDLRLA